MGKSCSQIVFPHIVLPFLGAHCCVGSADDLSRNFGDLVQTTAFGAPEPHERVRVIDGKAMAACTMCGWNDGSECHSSGSHELSLERGCVTSPFLQRKMDVVMQRSGEIFIKKLIH